MRQFLILFCFLSSLLIHSCSEKSGVGIFAKRSLHEQYGSKLKDAGLANSTLAQQWFTAAESKTNIITVKLPYQERGYFPSDKPKTSQIRFQGIKGEKITINIIRKETDRVRLFADLWHESNGTLKTIASLDSASNNFDFEVKETSNYLLRLQPELLSSGEYLLQITKGPSLGFPVQGKSSIQSKWGDGRDNNKRLHEGVDIFANRGTPAIASADGTVTRVGTNNLGGNVVFMRPNEKNYNLYYAHLDLQLVQDGQQVKIGDTLGLIGNTGNAITTVPHLHFGIYENGAVDPEPFINTKVSEIKPIRASFEKVGSSARLKSSKTVSIGSGDQISLPSNTIIWLEAATETSFKAMLPNEQSFLIDSKNVSSITPIRKIKLQLGQDLLNKPDTASSTITNLAKGDNVDLLGTFGDFNFVKKGELAGWIVK